MGFRVFGFLHFPIPQLHPLPPRARHAALPSAVYGGRVTFIFVGYFLNEFREQLFLHLCLLSFSFAHMGGERIPAVPGGVLHLFGSGCCTAMPDNGENAASKLFP